MFILKMLSNILFGYLLLTVLCSILCVTSSLEPAILQFKDGCDVTGQLLSKDANVEKLEKEITSISQDKVNYSFKVSYEQTDIGQSVTGYSKVENITNYVIVNATDYEAEERDYIKAIAEKFIEFSKPFDVSHSPTASAACRRHTQQFLQGLRNIDVWALKMHDATAKMNSGILNGNINQHGDFDQCLSVRSPSKSDKFQGQYCLAYAQPVLTYKSKKLKYLFKLIQSHNSIRTAFDDSGHRVPRVDLINWGVCVPSSCSSQDVEYTIKEYIRNMTTSAGVSFDVRVEPRLCQIEQKPILDRNTKLAILFFSAVLLVIVLSTIYDLGSADKKQNEWLTAFSLNKNVRSLFSINTSQNDIKAVHGIRFFNAVVLFMSHKTLAVLFTQFSNRTVLMEGTAQPLSVVARVASLYTDPFLMFSGMLMAYMLFGRLFKAQRVRLGEEYIGRFMRIVPSLVALILFSTYILPLLGRGPQWNLVVGHHSELCKKYWWRNLLFIHNYYGFEEMCLTHTHHLGIDTELFVVSPLLIYAMYKWPRGGMFTLIFLMVFGTAARYYTTYVNELSNFIYFGTLSKRLFKTAEYMYSFPPHRATVYLMGIFLGYCLRKYKNISLTSFQLTLGWIVAALCFIGSYGISMHMGFLDYEYNATDAAIYAAFSPIMWCTFFGWVVFTSHTGHTNRVTDFFSWSGFQITTRLSYSFYLTQFPLFFYNIGTKRHIDYFYNLFLLVLNTNEVVCIIMTSIVLTLTFDMPFNNIKKILFKRTPEAAAVCTNKLCDTLNNGKQTTFPKLHQEQQTENRNNIKTHSD